MRFAVECLHGSAASTKGCEMEISNCHCKNTMWAVFADLLQAVERMERVINDEHVAKWLAGYRDGILACKERLRITESKCCCQRDAEMVKNP